MDEGEGSDIPDEGERSNIPDEGERSNIPDEGERSNDTRPSEDLDSAAEEHTEGSNDINLEENTATSSAGYNSDEPSLSSVSSSVSSNSHWASSSASTVLLQTHTSERSHILENSSQSIGSVANGHDGDSSGSMSESSSENDGQAIEDDVSEHNSIGNESNILEEVREDVDMEHRLSRGGNRTGPVMETEDLNQLHPEVDREEIPNLEDVAQPNTVQLGSFQQLRNCIDAWANTVNENSLPLHNRMTGVFRYNQNTIYPSNGLFVLGDDWIPWDAGIYGQRGRVSKCHTPGSDNPFVVKKYSPDQFNRHEMELPIQHHLPCLPQPLGVMCDQNVIYTFQEYCDGITLSDVLQRRRPLTGQEVKWLNYSMLMALQLIHAEGIIHRNIHSDHIIISRERVKLYIVGGSSLCRIRDVLSICPTRSIFNSPEIARGDYHNTATDIYSLGLVLHACLSGSRIFFGEHHQQQTIDRMIFDIACGKYPINKYLNQIEPSWHALISRMSDLNQERRPSVPELLRDYYPTEPQWQDWYFDGNIYHHEDNVAGHENPVFDLPRSIQPSFQTGNIPSEEILGNTEEEEEEMEEEEEEEEEEGEEEQTVPTRVQPIPSKGASVMSRDSGYETNFKSSLSSHTQGTYRITISEHMRDVSFIYLPYQAFGNDLHQQVVKELKLNCGCVLRYFGRVIPFHMPLNEIFATRNVTVTLDRVPRDQLQTRTHPLGGRIDSRGSDSSQHSPDSLAEPQVGDVDVAASDFSSQEISNLDGLEISSAGPPQESPLGLTVHSSMSPLSGHLNPDNKALETHHAGSTVAALDFPAVNLSTPLVPLLSDDNTAVTSMPSTGVDLSLTDAESNHTGVAPTPDMSPAVNETSVCGLDIVQDHLLNHDLADPAVNETSVCGIDIVQDHLLNHDLADPANNDDLPGDVHFRSIPAGESGNVDTAFADLEINFSPIGYSSFDDSSLIMQAGDNQNPLALISSLVYFGIQDELLVEDSMSWKQVNKPSLHANVEETTTGATSELEFNNSGTERPARRSIGVQDWEDEEEENNGEENSVFLTEEKDLDTVEENNIGQYLVDVEDLGDISENVSGSDSIESERIEVTNKSDGSSEGTDLNLRSIEDEKMDEDNEERSQSCLNGRLSGNSDKKLNKWKEEETPDEDDVDVEDPKNEESEDQREDDLSADRAESRGEVEEEERKDEEPDDQEEIRDQSEDDLSADRAESRGEVEEEDRKDDSGCVENSTFSTTNDSFSDAAILTDEAVSPLSEKDRFEDSFDESSEYQ